jgi:RNA polymerase sigma-70 factor (ECF subfamily)
MTASRSGEVVPLEAALLSRARAGDRPALGALLGRHQRAIHALVARMLVGRPAEVDDVAQEALVKIARALPAFDASGPATLGSWMLTITARAAIDALRRPARTGGAELLAAVVDPAASPEEDARGRALASRLSEAMAALPDDQRAVLILRAFHDLDYPEIARALSLEVGTVKSRLSRARAALRGLLEEVSDE